VDDAQLKAKGWTRETKILRDVRGNWFEDGVLVEHPGVIRSFNAWIDVAPDGRYCLKNSIHWVYVEIEGAPVFVLKLRLDSGAIQLALSDGNSEQLLAESLRQDEDGALYCDVRGGRLVAQFSTTAVMTLSEVLDSDEDGLFLKVGAKQIRPPVLAKELALKVTSSASQ
jgi:hypothetical protein